MTGPSCWWSPTMTSCLAPRTIGMRLSGSVACVASSMRTCRKRKFARRGSPAPTQVVQMTSAAWRRTRSVWARSWRKRFSSAATSSPWSSLRRWSLRSSSSSGVSMARSMTWRERWSIEELTASRDLAQRRTTLRPVAWIFSASWSTAMFDGATTRTWPAFWRARWETMAAEVTVFPVPGGPWINERGCWTTALTAACCEWFRSGRPGTRAEPTGFATLITWGSTSWPRRRW
mmetsp:Transcript_24191/g.75649  ORF Transcript_24191/g.75649 Transcript_24191/m.75649 type:complete len:232 (-) Transcript_24191:974-1669(-)